jgi:hypothetical protein
MRPPIRTSSLGRKQRDDSFDEAGVSRIEQAVESFAVPQEADIDTCPKRGGHPLHRMDGDFIDAANGLPGAPTRTG